MERTAITAALRELTAIGGLAYLLAITAEGMAPGTVAPHLNLNWFLGMVLLCAIGYGAALLAHKR